MYVIPKSYYLRHFKNNYIIKLLFLKVYTKKILLHGRYYISNKNNKIEEACNKIRLDCSQTILKKDNTIE